MRTDLPLKFQCEIDSEDKLEVVGVEDNLRNRNLFELRHNNISSGTRSVMLAWEDVEHLVEYATAWMEQNWPQEDTDTDDETD